MIFNLGGKAVDMSEARVMGILNLTPDSFYDASRVQKIDEVLKKAEQMLVDGASILDLGGMSSRPGAEIISVEEELRRTVKAVEAIHKRFPEAIISIDTFRSEVVEQCFDVGATMVNDISGGAWDEHLIPTVGRLGLPYVLMHIKGQPATMQQMTQYDNLILEIMDYFVKKIRFLKALGINDFMIDPGFGFGKKISQNYELLRGLSAFRILDLPILVGISRKSMIYKVLGTDAQSALNGTTSIHMLALSQGAKILRVHDVKEAAECISLFNQYETSKNEK